MKNKMRYLLMMILLLSALAIHADVDNDYKFAKRLFDDGLLDESLDIFADVIENYPTSVQAEEALFYSGKAYLKNGKLAQAELMFKQLYEGYPNSNLKEETLFNYAQILKKQDKLDSAVNQFQLLIKKYPKNEFAVQSLIPLLQSFFQMEDYQKVVSLAEQFNNQYPDSTQIPQILLMQAKANYKLNYAERAEKILDKIIEDYENQDAFWEAKLLKVEKMSDRKAISYLDKYLSESIPRNFEEKYATQLIHLFLKNEMYKKADTELDRVIAKFNNSPQIDQLIILSQENKIRLQKYAEIITAAENQTKYFKESELFTDFNYYIAEAYHKLNNTEKSFEFIEKSKSQDEFKFQFLQAKNYLKAKNYVQAVNLAQNITRTFPTQAQISEVFIFIGDIYLNKLNKLNQAQKNYEMAISSGLPTSELPKIYAKISQCYQKKSEYKMALSTLEKININELDNSDFRENIINKKRYLTNYKIKDYETAVNNLIQSMAQFLKTDDKNKLQNNLTEIMINQLKDFDAGLSLLDKDAKQNVFVLADIYLKQAGKAILEGQQNKMNQSFIALDSLVSQNADNQQLIDKIKIEKHFLQANEVTKEMYDKLVNYISFYDDDLAENRYRIILAQNEEDENKKLQWLQNLQYIPGLNKSEFYKAKLELADYYLKNEDLQLALQNYQQAEQFITIEKPQIFFNYAQVLAMTDKQAEAKSKLNFLINNNSDFENRNAVIYYLADLYRQNSQIEKAVDVMKKVVENQKNDEYYSLLAEDYLALKNREMAKESLLRIQEKTTAQLETLAKMHYLTKSYSMAAYTYNQLLEKDDKQQYKLMLAYINFLSKDYFAANKSFAKIAENLETINDSIIAVNERVKAYTITLYNTKQRPKADKLYKNYRKILSATQKSEILIEKAKYYLEIDPDESEDILDDLIKDEAMQALLVEERFWRGVAYLKQKKNEKAEQDFQFVLQANIPEFVSQAALKLGTINFSKENYQEALKYYYQVIEEDKNGALAFDAARNFATVCKTIKEWQKAIDAYEIILERWGDQDLQAETIFDIAFCYYRDKNYPKSIEMFTKSLSYLDEQILKAEAQYWIGDSYFETENYEQAVTAFLKVSYNYPEITRWAATAELKAAESYIRQFKIEKAKKILNRIIAKYGAGSNWGSQAKQKLNKLN